MSMDKRKIIAFSITVILLVLILHKINWHELFTTFKLFDFKNMIPIVVLYTLSLYLRGIRWKILLLNNKKYSALNLGEIFIVGSMLNIFLPARAGDLYRAYYLGQVKQEKKMKIFGSVILERTLDGLTVLLILLSAVILYCKQQWILNLAYGIGAIFIGSLIFFYVIFKFNKIDWISEKCKNLCSHLSQKISNPMINIIEKIRGYANSFIEGFEVLNSAKYSLLALLTSIGIWGIECYVAYLFLNSFHLGLGFAAGLFVLSLISFSTMIPSTSVFLGPYQYAYILALSIFGINKSTALAISTVHQGILTIILIIVGGSLLLKFNSTMKDFDLKDIQKK